MLRFLRLCTGLCLTLCGILCLRCLSQSLVRCLIRPAIRRRHRLLRNRKFCRVHRRCSERKHHPVHGKVLVHKTLHGCHAVIHKNLMIHVHFHIHECRQLLHGIKASRLNRIALFDLIGRQFQTSVDFQALRTAHNPAVDDYLHLRRGILIQLL